MNVSGIAAVATDLSQASTATAVQLAVLKKALEVQAQGALQLVQAAARIIPTHPPHLGNQVDTVA